MPLGALPRIAASHVVFTKTTRSACHDAHVPDRPDSDREVLTSLPRSRPARRSAKRAERPARDAPAPGSAQPAAPSKPRTTKATPKTGPEAAAKPAARTARPRATGQAAPAAERTRAAPERKVPPAGYAAPDSRPGDHSRSPVTELVSTSIQAVAELAQIGLTVGRQSIQSMLERLPKP